LRPAPGLDLSPGPGGAAGSPASVASLLVAARHPEPGGVGRAKLVGPQAKATEKGGLGFGMVRRTQRDEVPEHAAVGDLGAVGQPEPALRALFAEALTQVDSPRQRGLGAARAAEWALIRSILDDQEPSRSQ
jgi:hypothetical protein